MDLKEVTEGFFKTLYQKMFQVRRLLFPALKENFIYVALKGIKRICHALAVPLYNFLLCIVHMNRPEQN